MSMAVNWGALGEQAEKSPAVPVTMAKAVIDLSAFRLFMKSIINRPRPDA
jgi:hypothetical protein